MSKEHAAFASWKTSALQKLLQAAASIDAELLVVLREEAQQLPITDERFTTCMVYILRAYGNNYAVFARDVFFDSKIVRAWSRGKQLPPQTDRKRILEHCIEKLPSHAEPGFELLLFLTNEHAESKAPEFAVLYERPSDETLLSDMEDWEELPVVFRSSLFTEGVRTLGEALSRSEGDYLRMVNMGRKNFNKYKAWLAGFGITLH